MPESQDTHIIFSQYAQDPYDFSDGEFNQIMQSSTAKKNERASTRRYDGVSTTSYVINKQRGKGKKLIKIKVYDLEEEASSSFESDKVVLTAAKYVVQHSADEIMDLTDHILSKISRKLVGCTW